MSQTMRYLCLSLAAMVSLTACSNKAEEERDAALANLSLTQEALNNAQSALVDARHNESEAIALAEERRTRGGLITSVTLGLTLSCSGIAGEDPQLPAGLATTVVLHSNESSWRLADAPTASSPVSKNAEDGYTVTLRYIPEDAGTIVGRTVDDLSKVTSLSTRYGPILRAIGLKIDTTKPIVVNLTVNGLTVIDSQAVPLPASDGSADFNLDVTAPFSKISASYDAAIKQKASAPPA